MRYHLEACAYPSSQLLKTEVTALLPDLQIAEGWKIYLGSILYFCVFYSPLLETGY